MDKPEIFQTHVEATVEERLCDVDRYDKALRSVDSRQRPKAKCLGRIVERQARKGQGAGIHTILRHGSLHI